jgi:cellulose synthase/poly-beta-1,6-N-acetylglucosamine synthase-like glycosyltransferase
MPVSGILAIAVFLIGVVVFIPVAVLFVEVLASFLKGRAADVPLSDRPRIAVIIPAHDEALTIVATVQNVRSELRSGDRVVVVADNCRDNTAALARQAGAEVVERIDPHRRGKGYALDFGIQHLRSDPPDVVVIVDADCKSEAGALARIAGRAQASGRPVQAHYEMLPPPSGGGMYISLASLAFRVKNYVRPLGCKRLGLSCQLMGTGMGFPWALISSMNLGTSEIVEDIVYGLEFARAGHPPLFYPDARVTSEFPVSQEGQATQRARWETGHLNTIWRFFLPLLGEAVRRRDRLLLGLALDLAVPPLAFLAVLVVAFSLFALPIAVLANEAALLGLIGAIVILFASAILLAWWRAGRDLVSLAEMLMAPCYAASKIGLYTQVFMGRKVGWIRSKRDASPS